MIEVYIEHLNNHIPPHFMPVVAVGGLRRQRLRPNVGSSPLGLPPPKPMPIVVMKGLSVWKLGPNAGDHPCLGP